MNYRHEPGSDTLIITLATGEELRIADADAMGVEGYGINVFSSKTLTVLPRASNGVQLTTPRAMVELEQRLKQVVAERDANPSSAWAYRGRRS